MKEIVRLDTLHRELDRHSNIHIVNIDKIKKQINEINEDADNHKKNLNRLIKEIWLDIKEIKEKLK